MKKLMLITAVTLTSVSAFASKARLAALQSSEHISDIQRVFIDKPEEVLNYEAATVEFGSATADQGAEGGFIRKMGDSAWSLYLGRDSSTFADSTSAVATALSAAGGGTAADEAAVLNQSFAQANPIQITYGSKMGDMSWGAGLFYVGNNNKAGLDLASNTETFQSTKSETNVAGLLLGATNGTWDAQARIGLMGKVEHKGVTTSVAALAAATELTVESTASYKLRGGYKQDTMYYYASYTGGAGEVSTQAGKAIDSTNSNITIGAVDSLKKDGTDFFYGASVVITENKEDISGVKVNETRVPLLVGVESEVNSWLTLRGAISQSLGLLSSTKTSGSSATAVADDTTTTMGAGFKWGKAMIDFTVGTGSTGTFGLDDDGDNFATAAVTYNF